MQNEKARQHRAFYILSLGCSKNQCDAEKLKGALLEGGFSSAESAEDADFIIINTCGFINDAKKESIDTILDAAELRDEHPGVKLIVTGCLSKRYFDDLKKEFPEVDLIYGLIDDGLIREIEKLAGTQSSALITPDGRIPLEGGLSYEYIKIAEGCSNNCSYCAIPLIRGPHYSFDADTIVKDAESAVRRGAKELIVIAQDIAMYAHKGKRLPDLLQLLAGTGAPWIRLLYCHPDHITDDIIAAIKEIPQVVHYLDIPFQHVSKPIVSAMNRKGDAETYMRLVEKLKYEIPDIAIRSTFMTGFPGETDAQAQELLDFLAVAKLDRVGAFTYSPEEGTPASVRDDIPEKIKHARHRRLMAQQKKISAAKLQEKIGRTMRVLVEEHSGGDTWIGRSEYDAPEVDGIFFLTGAEISLHDIVTATVTDAVEYDLEGTICTE